MTATHQPLETDTDEFDPSTPALRSCTGHIHHMGATATLQQFLLTADSTRSPLAPPQARALPKAFQRRPPGHPGAEERGGAAGAAPAGGPAAAHVRRPARLPRAARAGKRCLHTLRSDSVGTAAGGGHCTCSRLRMRVSARAFLIALSTIVSPPSAQRRVRRNSNASLPVRRRKKGSYGRCSRNISPRRNKRAWWASSSAAPAPRSCSPCSPGSPVRFLKAVFRKLFCVSFAFFLRPRACCQGALSGSRCRCRCRGCC